MKIIIVDDEVNMLKTLGAVLRREGFEIRGVSSGFDALKILQSEPSGMVISDMKMPGMSGLQLLREVRNLGLSIPFIMMTAFGTIEDAVEAMRLGASDYVTKPFRMEEIINKIRKFSIDPETFPSSVKKENHVAEFTNWEDQAEGVVISNHPAMMEIWEMVKKVSNQKTTVLITGESGTGKEVIAREIHRQGNRCRRSLIAVNCAALSPALLESELFGHEKGAFTGAVRQKPGRFELANGGTLFLDEIGEIPLEIQVKLLRVLQSHEFERVGGEKTIRVDTRVITATNRNLQELVQRGHFREDLYYRLNVIHIQVPSLRDHPQDIPALADHFLAVHSEQTGRKFKGFDPAAIRILKAYSWPGNIRELENSLERAVVLENSDVITTQYLPKLEFIDHHMGTEQNQEKILAVSEKETIRRVMRACGNNKAAAATQLGIGRTTLWRKLKKYNLDTD